MLYLVILFIYIGIMVKLCDFLQVVLRVTKLFGSSGILQGFKRFISGLLI